MTYIDENMRIESAKKWFAKDLLDPRYDSLYADEMHLQSLIDKCNLLGGKKYLDIGTGSGYVAFALARKNPKALITGIDIVEDSISRNARKAKDSGLQDRVKFISYPGTVLLFEKRSGFKRILNSTVR